jgi:hypothetical protein
VIEGADFEGILFAASSFFQKNKPKNNGTENRAKAARTKKNGGKIRPDILL